jgi:hypothetical protein
LNGSLESRVANRRGLPSAVHPGHGCSSLHARKSNTGGSIALPPLLARASASVRLSIQTMWSPFSSHERRTLGNSLRWLTTLW